MKKTRWFPVGVTPVHVGVYETHLAYAPDNSGFSWWDGEKWCLQLESPKHAYDRRDYLGALQNKCWRGLEEPK